MPADHRLIRASDQDRDRVAGLLREHHAVGRLDPEEFNERLDKVYVAKTLGDLEDLTADLPAIDPYPLPTASMSSARPAATAASPTAQVLDAMSAGKGRFSPAWQAAWGSWLTCSLVFTVIWLLTGTGFPWPLWVALPWGAILAGRWVSGSGPGGQARHERHRVRDEQRREIGGPHD